MVKAIVDINDNANRILNIVKAKENLRDKSDAINLVVTQYGKEMMEPELRPEFILEMKRIEKQKTIKVDNFTKRYGLVK